MTDLIQFAVLGLGPGSIFALLALGLVLVYRGSGTINLSHGAMATAGAYLMHEFTGHLHIPTVLAILLDLVLCGAIGVVVQVAVMRPLHASSPLARVVATLGVLTIIQTVIELIYGSGIQSTRAAVPTDRITVGSVTFGAQVLWLSGVAVIVTIVLAVFGVRTRLGLAISAAAESPPAAGALGWSTDNLALLTWGVGGTLAGLAGALVPAVTQQQFDLAKLAPLIISGLAAALFAQFRSYPMALVGGWLVGIVVSEGTNYIDATGVAESLPFVVIVVLLVLRGRGLPVRGDIADRLPSVGRGRPRPILVAALTGGAIVLVKATLSDSSLDSFKDLQNVVTSLAIGIVALSVVVLTGYTGQLSLAQMALGGIGAWVAGRLVSAHGWTFGWGLLAGVVVTCIAGVVLGLPALRTRGVNLTVVTFGLGFALYNVIFLSSDYTPQTSIPPQHFLGLNIEPNFHLDNYACLAMVLFALCGLVVVNVRRGRVGRRLLAVRANERAAASLGVNVLAAKLYAFALAAAIAAVGGVLLGFSQATIPFTNPSFFGPFASIAVVTVAVIGGLGWAMGPAAGMLLASGGIAVLITRTVSDVPDQYVQLFGGVALIVLLMLNQNGVVAAIANVFPRRMGEFRVRRTSAAVRRSNPVRRESLTVNGITQRFGGVTALHDVDLHIEPGTVVGLLGPNGAGKTTLVDVITGFARPREGRVCVGDTDVTVWSAARRARAGLARTFQGVELFDDLTVRENILAACEPQDRLAYLTDLLWPGRGRLTTTASAAIEELKLTGELDRLPTALSYGTRRLVAIARAVASGPSVILLDEPGAGLDEHESAELGLLIRRLAAEQGMAVLLIEHDVAMVLEVSDHVVVLDAGSVIYSGAPDGVAADTRVRTAYLGDASGSAGTSGYPVSVPI